ncbi:hypothetical protein GF378_00800 [Candidatus Pacearchaeota archaeon]|nr:hypothetical protein [Candidatus Pacearchaeota archaeon]
MKKEAGINLNNINIEKIKNAENAEAGSIESNKNIASVKQDEIHDLLFNRKIGWQEIIYDLINTEQLNPWDIDITILTNKYLQRIKQMEEADFFISSKVLFAAALLLRIKSEILLNDYIKSIDEILFGKKDEQPKEREKLEIEGEVPELVPRSPIPRFKKVTLKELVSALNKAITTENRRIRKEIINKNALRETNISLPKKTISLKDRTKELYQRLTSHFNENKKHRKISYTKFIGEDKETKIISFFPLLHLENQHKIWLDQEEHFEEIHIWLKKVYLKHNPNPTDIIAKEVEIMLEYKSDKEQKKRLKKLREEFKNPIGKD